jgi:hypothetical protein
MRLGFAQGSDERLTKPSLRRHPRTPLSRLHAIRAPLPAALVGRDEADPERTVSGELPDMASLQPLHEIGP